MSYVHLSAGYKRILSAGFLLAFLSGFGQSFFISVFAPHFLEALSLSQTQFGLIYSSATLASGVMLLWVGARLDYSDPVKYTLTAVLGFSLACFAMASMNSVAQFTLSLFGVRLCGQGLFSHISATVISRGFSTFRGRALSLTGLGHPFSEAILPTVAVYLVTIFGWRWAWVSFGGVLILLFVPFIPYLLRGKIEFSQPDESLAVEPTVTSPLRFAKVPQFVSSWRFWFLIVGTIFPGTVLTGLFLYHGVLAEQRGWSMAWMASGFAWFAASQILSSLLGGLLTDKYGAKKVFGFYLLPLSAGLALLSMQSSEMWIVPGYLTLAGISAGLGSPIKMSLWAEVYGTRQLATIRSWAGAIAVAGTAASVPILGFILDQGYGFSAYLRASTVAIVFYSVLYVLFSFTKQKKEA